MGWQVTRNGHPIAVATNLEDLRIGLAVARILPSDLVWHQGKQDWVRVDSIPGVVQPPNLPGQTIGRSEPDSLTIQTCAAFGLLAWAHFFDAWIFYTMGWTTAATISAGLLLTSITLAVVAFVRPSLPISVFALFWAAGLALYVLPSMLTSQITAPQIFGVLIRLGTIVLAINGLRATIKSSSRPVG